MKTTRYFLLGLIVSLGFCLSTSLEAQSLVYERYGIQQGLPQSQVTDIIEAKDGRLWLSTLGGGVSSFDGFKMNVYNAFSGLKSNFVHTLTSNHTDTIWVGTKKGLCQVNNKEVECYEFEDREERQVLALAFYKDLILAGTENGLYAKSLRIDSIGLSIYVDLDNIFIHDLFRLGDQLLIASNRGLLYLDLGTQKVSHFRVIDNAMDIIQLDDGALYVLTYQQGLFQLIIDDELKLKKADITLNRAKSLYEDLEGRIWICTEQNGIIKYNPKSGEIEQANMQSGLPTNRVNRVFRDHWGTTWIGTSGEGLLKELRAPFSHILPKQKGLHGNRTYALARSKTDDLLIAVNNGEIGEVNDLTIRPYLPDTVQLKVKVKSMTFDAQNRLWLGTDGRGLLMVDSLRLKGFPIGSDQFPDSYINQLVYDSIRQGLWAATKSSGLVYVDLSVDSIVLVNSHHRQIGLKHPSVTALTIDKSGTLWFGNYLGQLGYVTAGFDFPVLISNDILGLPKETIKCLAVNSKDELFFAIPDEGVYQLIQTEGTFKVTKLLSEEVRYSTNIYSMSFDNNHNLWVGSENGVYRIGFENGKASGLAHFDKESGFIGQENCHNAIIQGQAEEMWFGTLHGLQRFEGATIQEKKGPPLIALTRIHVNGEPLDSFGLLADPSEGITLETDQNQLSFEVQAIQTAHPEEILYRYKLNDGQEGWSPWTRDNRIYFANLPPGPYQFNAQSKVDDSSISEISPISFRIKKALWQKWEFQLGVLFLAFATLVFIIWSRIRRIKLKNEQKTKQLELENELINLEEKALQLQMNPHFLFNALNSIQALVMLEKPDEARKQLQNFARIVRTTLTNSKKKSICLKDEIKMLESYLNMEQFCQKNRFEYAIELAQDINAEDIMIPSMLIQPFVENAIIHGIANKENDGYVHIQFELQDPCLKCTIEDDGIGRLKSKEINNSLRKSHTSMGMDITTKRISALHGSQNEEAVQIKDLYDERGKARGTLVELLLPYTY